MSTCTRLLSKSPVCRLAIVLALATALVAIGGTIGEAGPANASTGSSLTAAGSFAARGRVVGARDLPWRWATPTSAEASAVTWAMGQVGQTEYKGVSWAGLCLPFVQDAYEKGTNPLIPPISSIAHPVGGWNSNTDPQDVWAGTFSAGTWSKGPNPPYGSLVFFDASHDPEDFSHVEIMGPNGVMIGTPGTPGQAVFEETLAHHEGAGDYNTYVGWWLPDGNTSPAGGTRITAPVTTNTTPVQAVTAAVSPGRGWSFVPPPKDFQSDSYVSCPGPSTCYSFNRQSNSLALLASADDGVSWNADLVPDAKVHSTRSGLTPLTTYGPLTCPTTAVCYEGFDGANAEYIGVTENAGGNWQFARLPNEYWSQIEAIMCASATTCFAMVGGTLDVTHDSGQSWKKEPTNYWGGYSGISCPTASVCYGEAESKIFVTKDVGDASEHWAPLSDQPGAYYELSCPDAQTCFDADLEGQVFWTHNGGANWAGQQLASTRPDNLICPTDNVCYLTFAPSNNQVYRTEDGGTSWTDLTLPANSWAEPFSCPSASTCFASGGYEGRGSEVLWTTDYGADWSYEPVALPDSSQSACTSVDSCVIPAFKGDTYGFDVYQG